MAVGNKIISRHQYKQIPANPLRLIIEIVVCVLLIIPAILWAVIKLFFKPQRKNVRGHVIMVSILETDNSYKTFIIIFFLHKFIFNFVLYILC